MHFAIINISRLHNEEVMYFLATSLSTDVSKASDKVKGDILMGSDYVLSFIYSREQQQNGSEQEHLQR